jgi:hypothetical protein
VVLALVVPVPAFDSFFTILAFPAGRRGPFSQFIGQMTADFRPYSQTVGSYFHTISQLVSKAPSRSLGLIFKARMTESY